MVKLQIAYRWSTAADEIYRCCSAKPMDDVGAKRAWSAFERDVRSQIRQQGFRLCFNPFLHTDQADECAIRFAPSEQGKTCQSMLEKAVRATGKGRFVPMYSMVKNRIETHDCGSKSQIAECKKWCLERLASASTAVELQQQRVNLTTNMLVASQLSGSQTCSDLMGMYAFEQDLWQQIQQWLVDNQKFIAEQQGKSDMYLQVGVKPWAEIFDSGKEGWKDLKERHERYPEVCAYLTGIGLSGLLTLEAVKMPWTLWGFFAAFFACIIGVLEIVVGVVLCCVGVTNIGMGMIKMGISAVVKGIAGMIAGNFDLGEFLANDLIGGLLNMAKNLFLNGVKGLFDQLLDALPTSWVVTVVKIADKIRKAVEFGQRTVKKVSNFVRAVERGDIGQAVLTGASVGVDTYTFAASTFGDGPSATAKEITDIVQTGVDVGSAGLEFINAVNSGDPIRVIQAALDSIDFLQLPLPLEKFKALMRNSIAPSAKIIVSLLQGRVVSTARAACDFLGLRGYAESVWDSIEAAHDIALSISNSHDPVIVVERILKNILVKKTPMDAAARRALTKMSAMMAAVSHRSASRLYKLLESNRGTHRAVEATKKLELIISSTLGKSDRVTPKVLKSLLVKARRLPQLAVSDTLLRAVDVAEAVDTKDFCLVVTRSLQLARISVEVDVDNKMLGTLCSVHSVVASLQAGDVLSAVEHVVATLQHWTSGQNSSPAWKWLRSAVQLVRAVKRHDWQAAMTAFQQICGLGDFSVPLPRANFLQSDVFRSLKSLAVSGGDLFVRVAQGDLDGALVAVCHTITDSDLLKTVRKHLDPLRAAAHFAQKVAAADGSIVRAVSDARNFFTAVNMDTCGANAALDATLRQVVAFGKGGTHFGDGGDGSALRFCRKVASIAGVDAESGDWGKFLQDVKTTERLVRVVHAKEEKRACAVAAQLLGIADNLNSKRRQLLNDVMGKVCAGAECSSPERVADKLLQLAFRARLIDHEHSIGPNLLKAITCVDALRQGDAFAVVSVLCQVTGEVDIENNPQLLLFCRCLSAVRTFGEQSVRDKMDAVLRLIIHELPQRKQVETATTLCMAAADMVKALSNHNTGAFMQAVTSICTTTGLKVTECPILNDLRATLGSANDFARQVKNGNISGALLTVTGMLGNESTTTTAATCSVQQLVQASLPQLWRAVGLLQDMQDAAGHFRVGDLIVQLLGIAGRSKHTIPCQSLLRACDDISVAVLDFASGDSLAKAVERFLGRLGLPFAASHRTLFRAGCELFDHLQGRRDPKAICQLLLKVAGVTFDEEERDAAAQLELSVKGVIARCESAISLLALFDRLVNAPGMAMFCERLMVTMRPVIQTCVSARARDLAQTVASILDATQTSQKFSISPEARMILCGVVSAHECICRKQWINATQHAMKIASQSILKKRLLFSSRIPGVEWDQQNPLPLLMTAVSFTSAVSGGNVVNAQNSIVALVTGALKVPTLQTIVGDVGKGVLGQRLSILAGDTSTRYTHKPRNGAHILHYFSSPGRLDCGGHTIEGREPFPVDMAVLAKKYAKQTVQSVPAVCNAAQASTNVLKAGTAKSLIRKLVRRVLHTALTGPLKFETWERTVHSAVQQDNARTTVLLCLEEFKLPRTLSKNFEAYFETHGAKPLQGLLQWFFARVWSQASTQIAACRSAMAALVKNPQNASQARQSLQTELRKLFQQLATGLSGEVFASTQPQQALTKVLNQTMRELSNTSTSGRHPDVVNIRKLASEVWNTVRKEKNPLQHLGTVMTSEQVTMCMNRVEGKLQGLWKNAMLVFLQQQAEERCEEMLAEALPSSVAANSMSSDDVITAISRSQKNK